VKKLIDLAHTLRSKNAGPLHLTIDILFNSQADFQLVQNSAVLTQEAVAKAYRVPADQVKIIPYPVVHAIKVTIPRLKISGASGDTDIYGCQQHMPLAQFIITEVRDD
jgi:hypothetical protein